MIDETIHDFAKDASFYIHDTMKKKYLKDPSKFYESQEEYETLVDIIEIDEKQVVAGDHIIYISKNNRRHDYIYTGENQVVFLKQNCVHMQSRLNHSTYGAMAKLSGAARSEKCLKIKVRG